MEIKKLINSINYATNKKIKIYNEKLDCIITMLENNLDINMSIFDYLKVNNSKIEKKIKKLDEQLKFFKLNNKKIEDDDEEINIDAECESLNNEDREEIINDESDVINDEDNKKIIDNEEVKNTKNKKEKKSLKIKKVKFSYEKENLIDENNFCKKLDESESYNIVEKTDSHNTFEKTDSYNTLDESDSYNTFEKTDSNNTLDERNSYNTFEKTDSSNTTDESDSLNPFEASNSFEQLSNTLNESFGKIENDKNYKDIKLENFELDKNFTLKCLSMNNLNGDIKIFKKIYIDNISKEFYPLRHIKKKYQYWLDNHMNDDDKNGKYIKETLIKNISMCYMKVNKLDNYNADMEQFLKNQEHINNMSEQKYMDKFLQKIVHIIDI